MGIPLFDETPEFEKSVAIASHEAAWMKRELESLVGSGKAASKVRVAKSLHLYILLTATQTVLPPFLPTQTPVTNVRRPLPPEWRCSAASSCVPNKQVALLRTGR